MKSDTLAPREIHNTRPAHLVRRRDDLEVPAVGTWEVMTVSHAAVALEGRPDVPVRVAIVDGTLRIADNPEQSELRLALAGPDMMTIVGRPTLVAADRQGMSRWSIAGTFARGGTAEPVQLTLTYHGVFRSTGRTWAWFSGTGALGVPGRGSRCRRSPSAGCRMVVLDLLLDTPTVLVRPLALGDAA